MSKTLELAQQAVTTSGLQSWLMSNIIPLAVMAVGAMLLLVGTGNNQDRSGVMRRMGPLLIGLAIIGFAVTGAAPEVARWMASLFTDA